MDTFIAVVVVAVIVLVVASYLKQNGPTQPPGSVAPYVPPAVVQVPPPGGDVPFVPDPPTPYRGTYSLNKPHLEQDLLWDDEEFETHVLGKMALEKKDVLNSFYTKLAGVKHKNEDGSPRASVVKQCEEADRLEVVWEPENAFDPNAMAVYSDYGQLGFIQSHLAAEQVADIKRHGVSHVAFFRHPNRHPETNRIVGAVIYLVQFSSE